jgi:hypothetical protein
MTSVTKVLFAFLCIFALFSRFALSSSGNKSSKGIKIPCEDSLNVDSNTQQNKISTESEPHSDISTVLAADNTGSD